MIRISARARSTRSSTAAVTSTTGSTTESKSTPASASRRQPSDRPACRTGVRVTVICVVLALYVIACGTTPKPVDISNRVAAPVEIAIAIDASTRDHLAFGLPVDVSLHTLDAEVGRCTLSFDLWEEHYRIGFSKTDVR